MRTKTIGCLGLLLLLVTSGQALAQDEAMLEILSSTDGATVSIDGEEVATTPMIDPIYLSSGGHLIRVDKPGFVAYEEVVVFLDGDEVLLEIDLIPFAGIVRVVTAEPGATVLIDGDEVGLTPYEGEVRIGEHDFRVERLNHEPWSMSERIAAGEEYFLEATLIPMPEETVVIIEETTPWFRTWWFWTATTAVVGGGIAAGIILSQDEEALPVDILIELP